METFLLFLAAGAYFLFALFRLEKAVLWLSFFFPFYLLRGTFQGIPFTLVEAFIYATAAAFGLRWLKEVGAPRGRFASLFSGFKAFLAPRESFVRRYAPLLGAVVLLVVAAFLSLLVTERELFLIDGQKFEAFRTALGILKGWIIAPVLYLLLLLAMVRSSRQGLRVLDAYTISAVALALWGLYQVIAQDYITPDARASGPFENANYLALYIAPAVLYTLVRVRELFVARALKTTEASLFLVGFLVLAVALLTTKSYGGMIATVLAALFYFGADAWQTKGRKIFSWKLLGAGVVLLGAGLALVFLIDPSKWQAMFQFAERNSSSVRIEVYTIAWGLLADNWLMGIGMGTFPAMYQLEAVNILGHEPFEWNMLHPHNLFLATWLNMGLLGLAALIGVLGACVQRVWDHVLTFGKETVVGVGKFRVLAFSLLLIVFVHGFFDTPFFKNDLSLLFWMIVAVLMAVREES